MPSPGGAQGHQAAAAAAPQLAQRRGRGVLGDWELAAGCKLSLVAALLLLCFEVLARQGWGRSAEYNICVRRKIARLNVSS